MSELTQTPQGEQPEVTTLEAAGTTPADTAALNAQIDTLNPAELAQALGFQVDDAAPDQTAENTPPQKPGEQPAGNDGEDGNDGHEADHKTVSRRRLSVTGIPDADKELNAQAIALVRDGKAANLFEAMKSLVEDGAAAGDDGAAANGDDDTLTSGDPAEAPPTLDELQSKIASLRAERRQAKADFDTDEELRLTEEIEDLQIAVLRAEKAEDQRQAEVSDYQAEYQTAVQEMESKYAALLDDEGSPFADLLEDRIEAARARRDPLLADPRHVLSIADDLARLLNMASAPKARTPIADPPPRAPVGGGVAPAGKAKAQLTTKQAEEFINKAPPEVLAAALWG